MKRKLLFSLDESQIKTLNWFQRKSITSIDIKVDKWMAKKLSNQFQGTCVMFVEDKLITFLQMFRNSLKFNSSFVASELAFVSTIHWRWSVVMVISSTCFGKKILHNKVIKCNWRLEVEQSRLLFLPFYLRISAFFLLSNFQKGRLHFILPVGWWASPLIFSSSKLFSLVKPDSPYSTKKQQLK